MDRLFDSEGPQPPTPQETALPFNVWLVQMARSREQREGRYVEPIYHTQKMPPEMCRRMIAHGLPAAPGVILDPFMGAGTTAVEGLSMGHSVVGVEIQGDLVDQDILPSISALLARQPITGTYDVRQGDARSMPWLADESADLCVCSPPYLNCDPASDSSGRLLSERLSENGHGRKIIGTTAIAGGRTLVRLASKAADDGALGAWSAMMEGACLEIRRILKPGAFALIALREVWTDLGLVDLPGILMLIAPSVGLYVHDQIYAIDAAMDRFGVLTSRASVHRHRLARNQEGMPCARPVPVVTRIVVLRRRKRKKGRPKPEGTNV